MSMEVLGAKPHRQMNRHNSTDEQVLLEIEALRGQIEDGHQRQGEALTSDRILELSRRLDRLITTYLRRRLPKKTTAAG